MRLCFCSSRGWCFKLTHEHTRPRTAAGPQHTTDPFWWRNYESLAPPLYEEGGGDSDGSTSSGEGGRAAGGAQPGRRGRAGRGADEDPGRGEQQSVPRRPRAASGAGGAPRGRARTACARVDGANTGPALLAALRLPFPPSPRCCSRSRCRDREHHGADKVGRAALLPGAPDGAHADDSAGGRRGARGGATAGAGARDASVLSGRVCGWRRRRGEEARKAGGALHGAQRSARAPGRSACAAPVPAATGVARPERAAAADRSRRVSVPAVAQHAAGLHGAGLQGARAGRLRARAPPAKAALPAVRTVDAPAPKSTAAASPSPAVSAAAPAGGGAADKAGRLGGGGCLPAAALLVATGCGTAAF